MATQIPNDLEIANEFAQQEIAAQPLTKPVEPKPESKVQNESEIKIEEMDLDDSIDAAIAGKKEQGYESSDLELSSDDDSSSSSEEEDEDDDDESSEDEKQENKNKKKFDDEEDMFPDGIVKTANEIVDVVVAKPEYEITPQTTVIMAGTVFQIIESVVVIHCRPNSEFSTLDQGSLLVYEDRQVMGEVFETFGPVARPYYSVRFSDSKDIKCKVGDAVFYVPEYEKTKIVETEKLKQKKYTDASNAYDEEASEDDLEFSDDEKEREHKRLAKMKKKGNSNNNNVQDHQQSSKFNKRQQKRPARQLARDFDSALADYEGSQPNNIPPRQQQSYADLLDDYSSSNARPQPSYNNQYQQQQPSFSNNRPTYGQQQQQQQQPYYNNNQPDYSQQQQTYQQQGQQSYQSPADLVSALFQSYGGQLPTNLRAPTTTTPQSATAIATTTTTTTTTTTATATNSSFSMFSEPPPSLSELEKQEQNK